MQVSAHSESAAFPEAAQAQTGAIHEPAAAPAMEPIAEAPSPQPAQPEVGAEPVQHMAAPIAEAPGSQLAQPEVGAEPVQPAIALASEAPAHQAAQLEPHQIAVASGLEAASEANDSGRRDAEPAQNETVGWLAQTQLPSKGLGSVSRLLYRATDIIVHGAAAIGMEHFTCHLEAGRWFAQVPCEVRSSVFTMIAFAGGMTRVDLVQLQQNPSSRPEYVLMEGQPWSLPGSVQLTQVIT